MPLNKLENFIKNTEGKILYVNPNDLDATDSITNQGNSLTKPFKTIQRALLESARFSYQTGFDNDITDKTTILVITILITVLDMRSRKIPQIHLEQLVYLQSVQRH